MKRLKILFHIGSLEQGGAERVVSTLANKFAGKYDVVIATLYEGENEYEIESGIKRRSLELSHRQQKSGRIGRMICRNCNLRKCIKEEKPDVVISFAKMANYHALIATIGTGIPVIVSVRTNPYLHYVNVADKILIPLLYSRAAGNVCQTMGAKDFFAPKLQERSRIILNPINEKYLDVPKPEIRKKEVVQSGRIVDFKNQHMLIEAFVAVHERHPDFVLKIYGTDSKDGTWELLEKCIHNNHADEYVFLMGGSNQLEKDLPEASVFAFSSDWEGLPNALMEAMAMGLPIVATDCPCGGPATLINDGENGLLIPIKDKVAMAEGINRLIENPALAEQLGENARKIADVAGIEMICKQWEDYILSICRRR